MRWMYVLDVQVGECLTYLHDVGVCLTNIQAVGVCLTDVKLWFMSDKHTGCGCMSDRREVVVYV